MLVFDRNSEVKQVPSADPRIPEIVTLNISVKALRKV
jgi:hypothetical protein